MKVSKRIFDLETESAFAILAKANKLRKEGKDIINLGIGQPDFHTPINIQEAAIKAIKIIAGCPFLSLRPPPQKYILDINEIAAANIAAILDTKISLFLI